MINRFMTISLYRYDVVLIMDSIKNHCRRCGAEIEISEKYRFCGNCGFPVESDDLSTPNSDDVKKASSHNSNRPLQYYCYARFVSIKADYARFQEFDGKTLFMPIRFYEKMEKNKGYYWLWVVHTNDGKVLVFPDDRDKRTKSSEFAIFASKYADDDRVVLPVKEVNSKSCLVWIGPSQFVNILRDEIDKTFNSSEIKADVPYVFDVKSISRTAGKYRIELKFVGSIKTQAIENVYKEIPDTISDVVIPKAQIARLQDDPDKNGIVEKAINGINLPNLAEFIDKKYQMHKRDKSLYIRKVNKEIRVDIDLGIKDVNGVPIKACVNKKEERDSFVLSLIGGTSPMTEMERFVYIPDWQVLCEEIASLALPEKWGYDETDKFSILKSYMKMTYYKARLDGLLYENEAGALFNTGLVDSSYDDIYCYLIRSKSVDDPFGRKWTLGFFACRGKGTEGKKLNKLFASFPSVPSYINTKCLENIFFDTSKDLFCDYQHIIQDNLERLPETFISQTLAYDRKIREWSDSRGKVAEIKDYILSKDELVKGLEDQLKSAVETATKYCKWNYKTAIPIYYHRSNNISLLLPLSVVKGSNAVDTALVVQLLPTGNYQGQTILTLEMAYMDARQICRPNSEWLTFEAIRDSVHSQDDD